MIGIINISPDNTTDEGENEYVVMINKRKICTFKHFRIFNGLSQCLRDAADAVDRERVNELAVLFHVGTEDK